MKALVVVLIAAAWTSPLTAQDSTRAAADSAVAPQTHLYRSPRRALILGSLIPGAGHIYAGEYWHGVVNYETTVAGIGGGLLTFMIDRCSFNLDPECDPGPQWPHRVLGVTMVGLGFWRWISSARDASRAAERANERHRRKMAKAKPIIEVPVGLHGNWRAGVAIPW